MVLLCLVENISMKTQSVRLGLAGYAPSLNRYPHLNIFMYELVCTADITHETPVVEVHLLKSKHHSKRRIS